ncbi:MAG: ATP-binding protein [Ignavibacteriaceae bacterium]|nr:ATP-binding protein [Ignavibacteriaceae bacterium]
MFENYLHLKLFPKPFSDIIDSLIAGDNCIIVEGNTNDRFVSTKNKLPFLALDFAIAHIFGNEFNVAKISKAGLKTIRLPGSKMNPANHFPKPTGSYINNPSAFLTQYFPLLSKEDSKTLIIIDGIDFDIPEIDPSMLTEKANNLLSTLIPFCLSDNFRNSGNILILKTSTGITNRALVKSGAARRINVPIPSTDVRQDAINVLAQLGRFKVVFQNADLERLALISNGIRIRDIEGIAKKCETVKEQISTEDILKAKVKAIEELSQGQLKVLRTDRKFNDIIGLDSIKNKLFREIDLSKDNPSLMSKSILFISPPGTGKTFITSAYANELEYLLVEMINVRSKWVGESESRLQAAYELLDSLKPVAVFQDEVDQTLGTRAQNAGDGGVDARLFGETLKFRSSINPGEIQMIDASNAPHLLDPAFVDRESEIMVFGYPNPSEIVLHFKNFAIIKGIELNLNDNDFAGLAMNTKLRTASVRELDSIINKASEYADTESKTLLSSISKKHLAAAIENINIIDTVDKKLMMLYSIKYCKFKDQLQSLNGIPEEVLNDEGEVDMHKVEQLIHEYRGMKWQ